VDEPEEFVEMGFVDELAECLGPGGPARVEDGVTGCVNAPTGVVDKPVEFLGGPARGVDVPVVVERINEVGCMDAPVGFDESAKCLGGPARVEDETVGSMDAPTGVVDKPEGFVGGAAGFVDEPVECLSGAARDADESAGRVDKPPAEGYINEPVGLVDAPA